MSLMCSCYVILMGVVFYLLMPTIINAMPSKYADVSDGTERRSCGRILADRISLVCNGIHNVPVAANNEQKHHRVRRGIVDECCKKGCTNKTIGYYCLVSQTGTSYSSLKKEPVMNKKEKPSEEFLNKLEMIERNHRNEKQIKEEELLKKLKLEEYTKYPIEIGTVSPEYRRQKFYYKL